MEDIKNKIKKIKEESILNIEKAKNSKEIEELRIHYLGKKSELINISKQLGSLSVEERPVVGALINEAKNEIENILEQKKNSIEKIELEQRLYSEKIDITLPGRVKRVGAKNPLRILLEEIEDIFLGLGFSIEEGPEIDTEYYNFKSMNFEDDHPARDAQDTFYINEKVLFRTHTSPVQARTMHKMKPNPIRVICPGRVFRRDNIDATHSVQFHQVEGLVVDKDVKFSDLIGILDLFSKKMFGEDTKIRLRPSFFPFTEPSAEVDVSCIFCNGKGCPFCKHSGWLEILGAGCVHPNVLRMGGYDPEIFTGWAFGMGVERIALLKYQINDIRLFLENDIKFLHQFR